MNDETTKAKKQVIISLSELYGIKMTKLRLDAYLFALEELTAKEIKTAFEKLLKDPSMTRMPLPAQILQTARPTKDPKTAAIESMDRIREAVKRYGWAQPSKAMDYLSDQEWSFVCRRGGWEQLCGNPENNINDPIIYAQMRDALASENVMAKQGFKYTSSVGSSDRAELPKGRDGQVDHGMVSAKTLLNGMNLGKPE